MTDDRSLERAARSWLEEEPTRAPDRPVEAALARIQTTRQERDLRIPWRFSTMKTVFGLGAAALVALLAVGVAIIALRPASNVGPAPTTTVPTATATSVPTAPAAAIPPGTYRAAPIMVATILADLNDEPGLTAEEKAAIVDEILSIRDAEVLDIELVVSTESLIIRQGTDGGSMYTNPTWRLFPIDANRIELRPFSSDAQPAYEVTWTGRSFTLRAVSPGPSSPGGFVSRVMLESEPFTPVP